MASGRSLLSRSFKYHRPRGALTMAGHDVNAMVQVGAEPNVRGDRHPIEEGMAVASINRLGSLDSDRYAAISLFSRFLPVGFYYKTFFRPSGAWKYFERPIRKLAGLGKLDPEARHGHYDKQYLFCDVLVVGGGPAGLAAAIASAEAGAETILMDEWTALGGSLLFGRAGGARAEADARRGALTAAALATRNLTVMTDTTVTGLFSDGWASATSANRLYKVRAAQTVLATGSFDQPLVFRNNDLPGILFADAAQRLMRLYGVKPGRRAVVVTANRFGYEAALDLSDAGVDVAAIVDLNLSCAGKAPQEASARGIRILSASTLIEARGRRHVEAVAVARVTGRGKAAASLEWIECDLVAMSVPRRREGRL
jgi:sarcosine oxidase, subunit alpha